MKKPADLDLATFLVIGSLLLAPATVVVLYGGSRLAPLPADPGSWDQPEANAVQTAGQLASPAEAALAGLAAQRDDCGEAEPCLAQGGPAARSEHLARAKRTRRLEPRPSTTVASR